MRACRRLIDTSFCEMPCELQMFEATHASRVRETAQSLDVLPKLDLVWYFQQWPHEKLMLLCSWHCTVLYFLVQNKLSLFLNVTRGWMTVSVTVLSVTQIYYARLIALFSRMIGWFLLISKSTNIDWIRIENRHTWHYQKVWWWVVVVM